MKLRNIALATLFGLSAIFFTACDEDKYTSRPDLFQPRFMAEPEVELNSIAVVWYEVDNAVDYTVEVHLDGYYRSLFYEQTSTDTYLFLDDVPYGTMYYFRVRSNARDSIYNSQWAYTSAMTEIRPDYAKLLQEIDRIDISEESVIIRWTVDPENPVDSITVQPAVAAVPSVERYLTQEEIQQGWAEIDGLVSNTVYLVNIYDTGKPRRYDRPYNQESFRTAGVAAETIVLEIGQDFNALLQANNIDETVAEGTEYFLPAGSYYELNSMAVRKAFKIVGSTEGDKPIVRMNGNFSTYYDGENIPYLGAFEFENVHFIWEAVASYFFNTGNPYVMESAYFFNCDFEGVRRGFWRHQADNAKEIGSITMEYCKFDRTGGYLDNGYGIFQMGSSSGAFDKLDKLVIRNTTIMRDIADAYMDGATEKNYLTWKCLFEAPNMATPIDLQVRNVTLYNCLRANQVPIRISNAVGSTVTIENLLLATSTSGEFIQLPARTTENYADNYALTDYLYGVADIDGIKLEISSDELFRDPTNGNLSVTDENSPIVINRVGDPRWLPGGQYYNP